MNVEGVLQVPAQRRGSQGTLKTPDTPQGRSFLLETAHCAPVSWETGISQMLSPFFTFTCSTWKSKLLCLQLITDFYLYSNLEKEKKHNMFFCEFTDDQECKHTPFSLWYICNNMYACTPIGIIKQNRCHSTHFSYI